MDDDETLDIDAPRGSKDIDKTAASVKFTESERVVSSSDETTSEGKDDKDQAKKKSILLQKMKNLVFKRKVIAFIFSHAGLLALVIIYTIMGGFLFKYLEGGSEQTQRTVVSGTRSLTVSKLWNMTTQLTTPYENNWTQLADEIVRDFQQSVVDAFMQGGWDGREEGHRDVKWSMAGSLLYSITVLTTIGYGHIAPKTRAGRIITMLYALPGIPLTLLCLSTIGSSWAKCFRLIYSYVSDCILRRISKNLVEEGTSSKRSKTVRVPLFVSLLVIGGYIAGGAVLFSVWEKEWDYLIAAYFCFVTLSTIGFGDYVFGVGNEIDSNAKLVTSGLYLVMGLSIIAMCFNLMQEEVKEKFLSIGKYFGFIEKKKKIKAAQGFY